MSWIVTRYLTILFAPFFPLGRYRVRNLGSGEYAFLGALPLERSDIVHRWAAALAVIVVVVVVGFAISQSGGGSGGAIAAKSSPASGVRAPAPLVPADDDVKIGDCVLAGEASYTRTGCATAGSARVVGLSSFVSPRYPTESERRERAEAACIRKRRASTIQLRLAGLPATAY